MGGADSDEEDEDDFGANLAKQKADLKMNDTWGKSKKGYY